MICLVGDQPVPNLLPFLHYRPARMLLVHTERVAPAANLAAVVKKLGGCEVEFCSVPPYRIAEATEAIEGKIGELVENGWRTDELMFNLTGGTKAMVLAGYQVANRHLGCPLIYVESERNFSYCYEYQIEGGRLTPQGEAIELTSLLNIDLYLSVMGVTYKPHGFNDSQKRQDGTIFQNEVAVVLEQAKADGLLGDVLPSQDLMPGHIDADVIVLLGNKLGVIEVKHKKLVGKDANNITHGSAGINQLMTLAEPRYLGTYAVRIYVGNCPLGPTTAEVARARGVYHIQLSSWDGTQFSADDREKLVREVIAAMQGKKVNP